MKILQVHTEYRHRGGEETVVRTEGTVLREAGHIVVTHREPNPLNAVKAAADLAQACWNTFAARRIARVVGAVRPDVTHFHNTWFHMSPAVFQAARRVGSPTVATLHNYRSVCPAATMLRDGQPCELCVGTRNALHAIRHRCFRGSYVLSAVSAAVVAVHRRRNTWSRDLDLVVALTDFARGKLVEGGLDERNIVVKPNCVADPGPRRRKVDESNRILFVGRLSPEKGVDVLVEAWKAARLTKLELELIGEGDVTGVSRAGDLPGLTIRGALSFEEVRARMLDSRALVFPSIGYEGLPMAILEAFSCGLPVLCSRLGAMRELVAPLGPRWLVPPNAVSALADRLRMLADDPAVAEAGRRARREYERRYSVSRGVIALEALYEEAIRRRATCPGDGRHKLHGAWGRGG